MGCLFHLIPLPPPPHSLLAGAGLYFINFCFWTSVKAYYQLSKGMVALLIRIFHCPHWLQQYLGIVGCHCLGWCSLLPHSHVWLVSIQDVGQGLILVATSQASLVLVVLANGAL